MLLSSDVKEGLRVRGLPNSHLLGWGGHSFWVPRGVWVTTLMGMPSILWDPGRLTNGSDYHCLTPHSPWAAILSVIIVEPAGWLK